MTPKEKLEQLGWEEEDVGSLWNCNLYVKVTITKGFGIEVDSSGNGNYDIHLDELQLILDYIKEQEYE